MNQRTTEKKAPALRLTVRWLLFCLLLSTSWLSARGQYAIDWFTIDGGGGTSTNGQYSLTGTIGQPDAGGTMSGGNYSLTGGFWSLIAVVPTTGAPTLYISHSGNSVTVYWQSTGSWTLQQNGSLTVPASWVNCTGVITSNGTSFLTIVNPTGSLFYRLKPQ
jgi:hypothetical protein